MSNHTPGPWVVFDKGNNYGIDSSSVVQSVVVHGYDDTSATRGILGRTHDEMVANARLIAAAPDMLGMLQHYIANVAGADDQTHLLFEKQVADLLAKVEA